MDKKDTFGLSDPFLEIHRQLKNGKYELVTQTDVIKNTLTPRWEPLQIKAKHLMTDGNADDPNPVLLRCYDWNRSGEHEVIGECVTSVKEIRSASGRAFPLTNPDTKKPAGIIIVESVRAIQLDHETTKLGNVRRAQSKANLALDRTMTKQKLLSKQ